MAGKTDSNNAAVGIDLGTTNSEVAGFVDGKVQIIRGGPHDMLPSCVALSPTGELLIGHAARNQQLLYPDRTVRSIKRKMGSDETVTLGDKTFTPPEISALILRELAAWAQRGLGGSVRQAVITVPAYFSDAQRQATREAGALADLEVIRLINEPTAASLAYGCGEDDHQTVMVYDLGGGTFDVSIVDIHGDVTQVLASHGNAHLGGDDFDQVVVNRLRDVFMDEHGVDLSAPEHRSAYVRLCAAAEAARIRLSSEPFAAVREEALVEIELRPVHLNTELARSDYESMIRPFIESTMDSVSKALVDAGKTPGDIDVLLLVGGATRTPLVAEMLKQRMGATPRQDVHPDLCVALGAGVLASRSAGHQIERVLVDVSPYSFGVSYLSDRDGLPYPFCYKPIIHRNTPLPVTRTELYATAHDEQTEVEVNVFQGENPDALHNTLVGNFLVTGLIPVVGPNEVLCRMKLDLDGILEVTAIEKATDLSKQVSIADALSSKSPAELEAARNRLAHLFETRDEDDLLDVEADFEPEAVSVEPFEPVTAPHLALVGSDDSAEGEEASDPALAEAVAQGRDLVARSRKLIEQLHADDRIEAVDLNEQVEQAITVCQAEPLRQANDALREFLFFVEGR